VSASRGVSATMRPKLAPKARLRYDRKTTRYMLLYPERGLELNPTAADIVRLCTGAHTLDVIVEHLAAKYSSQPREAIAREVMTFLAALAERGLVKDGDA
jgi:coenzyme PQQ biosynthesis protein PqqD